MKTVRNLRSYAGFTYTEITITAAIIMILAAIAVPNFLEAKTRARVSAAYADISTVSMALNSYRQENRAWPKNQETGVAGVWDLTVLTTPIAYLTQLPYDQFRRPTKMDIQQNPEARPYPYRFFNASQANPTSGVVYMNVPLNDDGTTITDYGPNLQTDPQSSCGESDRIQRRALSYGSGDGRVDLFVVGDGPAQKNATVVTRKGEVYTRVYDPTNGTSSFGDIIVALPF